MLTDIIEIQGAQEITEIAVIGIEVVEVAGLQGPPGPPGSDGNGSSFSHTFAYGDVAHIAIGTSPASSKLVLTLRVLVETGFDGAGAQISIGTAGQPALLVQLGLADLATPGTYEFSANTRLPASTPIFLTYQSGTGGTAGLATIVVAFEP